MLYAKCQIGGQQTAASGVEVQAVSPKKMPPLPESIKIVYKTHAVGGTGGGEPGVEAEQPAEAAYPPAAGGGGARDKNIHLELSKQSKQVEKIHF